MSVPERSATVGKLLYAGNLGNIPLVPRLTTISKKSTSCVILLSCFFLCFVFLVMLLLLGKDRESRIWHAIKPLHHICYMKTVCSIKIFDGATGTMLTKDLEYKHRVLHCGTCAQCLSMEDISIYFDTRNTLTTIATNAAKVILFRRHQYYASQYLKKRTDMSEKCVNCWVWNIACTLDN